MDKLLAKLEEVLMGKLTDNPAPKDIYQTIEFLKLKYMIGIKTD